MACRSIIVRCRKAPCGRGRTVSGETSGSLMGTASRRQGALSQAASKDADTGAAPLEGNVDDTGIDTFRFFENANCRLSG
jgi:hypothetical protein